MRTHNIGSGNIRSYSDLPKNSKEEKEAWKILRNKFNYSGIGI